MQRLGEILVDMKACTQDEVRAALQAQSIFGGRLGTTLLELGIVNEPQLAAALSRAHGLPCVKPDIEPEEDAIAALTAPLVERYGAVPLAASDKRLWVAIADPRNLASLDDLAFATGKHVEPMIAPEARLWALMRRFYGIDHRLRGLEVEDDLESAPGRDATLRAAAPGGARVISPEETLALIERMSDPVVLAALLVRGAAGAAQRAVLLKAHGARAVAWLGAGNLVPDDVRGASVVLGPDGPFGAAVELRAPALGRLPADRSTAQFLGALGGAAPMNAFVAPVVLRGRAVALLYADAGPGGTLREEAAALIELAAALNRRLEALAPVAA